VISSELIELIGLAHRVAVMRAGRLVATVSGEEMTEETMISYATGARHVAA
jgi:ribose transport system ATP-binding protein